MNTSDIFENGVLSPGPELPVMIGQHCMAQLSVTEWMIIGGAISYVSTIYV